MYFLGAGENRSGYWPLFVIGVYALVLTVLFTSGLHFMGKYGQYVRSPKWLIAWFSLAFYIAWWLVYLSDTDGLSMNLRTGNVGSLRRFLQELSPRGTAEDFDSPAENEEALVHKAAETIGAVGAIMGFSLLIFSFTINILLTEQPVHLEVITKSVLAIQVFAVANFLIAIDSLDTTMNEFLTLTPDESYRCTQEFYERGIIRYYNGLIALVFSIFLTTLIIDPLISVLGVVSLTFMGYPYWFGYDQVVKPRTDS